MKSNNKIESELLERAIDEGFKQLAERNPELLKLPLTDQQLIKTAYGWGFVDGTTYAMGRFKRLTSAS